jgi:hypothetical protein
MLISKVWDCLQLHEQQLLWDVQADRYGTNVAVQRLAQPDVAVHFSGNTEDVPAIMQATPGEVKHGGGVFGEKAG